jgi:PAS domain S-box-containing protein
MRMQSERLRIVQDQAPVGVCEIDLEGHYLRVNDRFCEITGYSREELLAKRFQDITHPEDVAEDVEAYRRQAEQDFPYRIEKRYVHKDGHIVWIELDGYIVRDGQGRAQFGVGIVQDITEQKRVKDHLREREEYLRLAVEGGQMGTWEWDTRRDRSRWNAREYELLGLPVGDGEIATAAFLERVHPEDLMELRAKTALALETGEDFSHEFRIVRPGGEVRWLAGKGKVIRDHGGEPTRMIGVNFDITERRRAEEILRRSEARFRLLVETAQEGIWSVDALGRTEYINQRMAEMLGYALQDLLGRSVFDFTFEEDRDTAMRLFRQCLADSKMQFDFRLRRADGGELWVGVAAGRIVNENGEVLGALALFSDVTERRRAEAALKEADRCKNEFLAMLSHELRNPLAPIRAAVQAMRKLDMADPKQHWARDVVDRQVNQLTRLVDDLLDVSRIVQGKLTLKSAPLDLVAVIEQAVETARPVMEGRRHTFIVSVPQSSIRLEGDAVRLVQVFSNLLDNAAKYTPEGGSVWLTVTLAGGEAAVSVRDTGEGIAAVLLPYLFDIFTQAERSLDRSQGGLGLGLTIVQKIVEMHGGRIEAKSEGLGKGSEFIVRLPIHELS